jgi:hypothetical protein
VVSPQESPAGAARAEEEEEIARPARKSEELVDMRIMKLSKRGCSMGNECMVQDQRFNLQSQVESCECGDVEDGWLGVQLVYLAVSSRDGSGL